MPFKIYIRLFFQLSIPPFHTNPVLASVIMYTSVPPRFEGTSRATGRSAGGGELIDNPQVVENEIVRLRCLVKAYPPAQVTWYKNGDELVESMMDDRMRLNKGGRELEIIEASVEDTARYTCVARNLAGEAEKNFDLDVQGAAFLSRDDCLK